MFDDLVSILHDVGVSTFGRKVIIEFKSGNSQEITGIFDKTPKQFDFDTKTLISSNDPMLSLHKSDLQEKIKIGDFVIVDAIEYEVIDVQEDLRGGIKLMLNKI